PAGIRKSWFMAGINRVPGASRSVVEPYLASSLARGYMVCQIVTVKNSEYKTEGRIPAYNYYHVQQKLQC
ncbi:hypothetical protein SEE30663_18622, partial [Salmonella enterica subsp. enterica serovar Enteritidis str. SE30663]